jgi:hypothetical protein
MNDNKNGKEDVLSLTLPASRQYFVVALGLYKAS